ncbi:MAG: thioredoxin [Chloroflexi bacterium]|nr:thioredoxin [Chloroflexota bacterium]
MTKPETVTDETFDNLVLHAKSPVLVDFWAPWCGPCRRVTPIVEELAEEYTGKIGFVKLNVDENPKTAVKYSIRSIPTLLVFKEGKPVQQMVGYRPKDEIKSELDSLAT